MQITCLVTRESHHASSLPAHDGEKNDSGSQESNEADSVEPHFFHPAAKTLRLLRRASDNLVVAMQSLAPLVLWQTPYAWSTNSLPKRRAGTPAALSFFPLTTGNQQRYTCLVAGLRNCISCYRTTKKLKCKRRRAVLMRPDRFTVMRTAGDACYSGTISLLRNGPWVV